MLLLKKKKYAAVTISQLPNGEFVTSQELKGLDIVRRDWSQISAEAGKYVSDWESWIDSIESKFDHFIYLAFVWLMQVTCVCS